MGSCVEIDLRWAGGRDPPDDPESLQKLLETYFNAVDSLLSAYLADMKSVLNF